MTSSSLKPVDHKERIQILDILFFDALFGFILILTFVIFIIQIFFSRFWLNRYYYGPFEWLWKSLTYKKIQKFRIY
ncbi:MAG: uncharacterized protein PWP52_503 [Bacteroidales bacterium]|nr:uncharacterized protein [Bacteroidales bacterium]